MPITIESPCGTRYPRGMKPSRHHIDAARIFTTGDAKRRARRRLPRLVFDFIEGGTGRDNAVAANRAALDAIKLQPRVLRDVSKLDPSTRFLGQSFDVPFGIAPMGMCCLTHLEADRAMAAAARTFGLPVCLSTAASTSIEEMARRAGDRAWFQLYVGASAEAGLALADRARSAGYETLVFTVDTPHVSRRVRDMRNGFQVPFRIGPRQAIDFALHPRWALPMLMTTPPAPANFDMGAGRGFSRDEPRAGADWAFLARLRDHWQGRLVIKGVTSPEDAVRIRDLGADAIGVSTHGGRQLDAAPAAIDALPQVRAAVGPDMPLMFDSGIESGDDIARALALGADFVLIGRPWLYALGAAGPAGLFALAEVFRAELRSTMAQIGITRIADITGDCLATAHPT